MARHHSAVIGILLLGALVAASQACGGSSEGVPDGPLAEAGAGTETSTSEGGDLTDAAAAADAPDAEVITDGGANIDPDAGDLADAGPDGGACNTLANDAPPIVSVCVSSAPVLGGGALVAGTYFLTHVAALATPNFCAMKFVPTGFKETLALTVAGSVGTAETHTNIGNGVARRRTTTLTPSGTNQSPLAAAPSCPVAPSATVPYSSFLLAGKPVLILRLAYGTGEALYRFEKQ